MKLNLSVDEVLATTRAVRKRLDFEKPVADLEGKIKELRTMEETGGSVDISDEIARLALKSSSVLKDMYGKLNDDFLSK